MSIRLKILLGLITAFALIFGTANFVMLRTYRSDDEAAVAKDLHSISSVGQFYTKQDLLINNDSIDADSFSAEADSIVEDLGKSQNIYFAAYTLSGRLISSNGETVFLHQPASDLNLAVKGKSAYNIRTTRGRTTASFSFPVVVNGQKIGILRCVNDYTSVYEQSDTNMRLINIIILGGFLLCLLFGVVLSSSVITPIRRLRSNLKSVAGGINGGDLDTSAVSYKLNLKRRDEIGDLARVTVDLIEKISLQINVINKDREELSRLSEYRRDFYNIVTHELKTPLTSIKGYAEVARSNGFSDPDFFDMAMSRIMEESDRLHNMVVTLLEESRLNKTVDMPLERVDLRETAESVCDSMQYKAQKYDRTLNLNAADACWVLGDPQGLRELIINLLDNAIKYASDSLIEIKISGDDRYVRLEVLNPVPFGTDEWDGGFMLPPGDSAKHEKGSVGLGIGICRQIAEKHNGTIRYSLSDDDILNVTVTLPAYRGL